MARSIRTKATTKSEGRFQKAGWFIALWLLGVGAITLFAYLLRWIMSGVYGGGV